VTAFLNAVGFGIVTASFLALATTGLSLQYSVSRLPNFAQGDIMTVGAYAAYVANGWFHSLVFDGIFAGLAGAAMAWIVYMALIRPFANRLGTNRLTAVVSTLAGALIIENVLLMFFGGNAVAFPTVSGVSNHIGPFLLTNEQLVIIGVSLASIIALHALLKFTIVGKAVRAVADHRDLARVSGLPAGLLTQLTWAFSGLLTGVSGFVLGLTAGALVPTLGFSYLLVIFAAAVVGGIGSIRGALGGALIIGVGMEVSAVYLSSDYKQVFALFLLIATILIRPTGLLGGSRSARKVAA